jgi:hypothetical protein
MRIKNRIQPSGVCVDDLERNIFLLDFILFMLTIFIIIFSSLSRVFDNAK